MKKSLFNFIPFIAALLTNEETGKKYFGNPYAIKGGSSIDTSDKARKETANRIRINREKPWRGMKYFSKYHVWAINEKNAIRKSSNHVS